MNISQCFLAKVQHITSFHSQLCYDITCQHVNCHFMEDWPFPEGWGTTKPGSRKGAPVVRQAVFRSLTPYVVRAVTRFTRSFRASLDSSSLACSNLKGTVITESLQLFSSFSRTTVPIIILKCVTSNAFLRQRTKQNQKLNPELVWCFCLDVLKVSSVILFTSKIIEYINNKHKTFL